MSLAELPAVPACNAEEFVADLCQTVERLLRLHPITKRAPEIFVRRTSQDAGNRMTLQRVADELETHLPTIKREESVMLAWLNDVLIAHDFSSLQVWLDASWLRYWAEASDLYDTAIDYDNFADNLAWRWRLTGRSIREAAPLLWAVMDGYPDGRRSAYSPPAEIEASAEPSVLAGLDGENDYVIQTNLVGTLNALAFARHRVGATVFLATSRVYSLGPAQARARARRGLGPRQQTGQRGRAGRDAARRRPGDGGVERGLPHRGFSLTIEGLRGLLAHGTDLARLETFPHLLAMRGTADLVDFPYGEDGKSLWAIIHRYVERTIALHFPDDAAIAADVELASFWRVRKKISAPSRTSAIEA